MLRRWINVKPTLIQRFGHPLTSQLWLVNVRLASTPFFQSPLIVSLELLLPGLTENQLDLSDNFRLVISPCNPADFT